MIRVARIYLENIQNERLTLGKLSIIIQIVCLIIFLLFSANFIFCKNKQLYYSHAKVYVKPFVSNPGAGKGARTPDLNLGKVAL
jgi:hypothetical protein